jgi:glycosyltransferase involved in cell wall biosynthesis
MKPQPLVSVLMPCYNSADFLHEAIDSVLNQTYRNFEFIIIDDGSSDQTPAIIEHYARLDSRIRFFKNDINRKLIYSLNMGVQLAVGEYIMRMDADDISHPQRLEKQLHFMIEHPDTDICSAGYSYINLSGHEVQRSFPKTSLPKALFFQSFFSTPLTHAVILAKTGVLKNNAYDPDFIHSEDFELFSRLLAAHYRLRNLNEILYYVRINPKSVSYRFERVQTETHTRISKRNILNYFNKKFEFFLHKVIIYRIAFHPEINMVNEAIRELELLKEEFLLREQCTPEETLEIELFLIEHKIDILIQSFKASTLKNKIRMLAVIYRFRSLFMTEQGKKYIRSKFRRISSLKMF